MDLMGFTLNNITMLGLILAVGIVIDDAVVVHENIFRHMEEDGRTAWEAASVGDAGDRAGGAGDDAVAGWSSSLPIAFMGGQVGRFFNSFGFVVGVRDPDEHGRLLHADADAVRAVPEAARASEGTTHASAAAVLAAGRRGGYGGILALVAAAPLGDRARHASLAFLLARRSLFDAGRHGLRAEGRPERVRGRDHRCRRATRSTGPTRPAREIEARLQQLPRRDATSSRPSATRPAGVAKGQGDVTAGDDLLPA